MFGLEKLSGPEKFPRKYAQQRQGIALSLFLSKLRTSQTIYADRNNSIWTARKRYSREIGSTLKYEYATNSYTLLDVLRVLMIGLF